MSLIIYIVVIVFINYIFTKFINTMIVTLNVVLSIKFFILNYNTINEKDTVQLYTDLIYFIYTNYIAIFHYTYDYSNRFVFAINNTMQYNMPDKSVGFLTAFVSGISKTNT